jgi:hypothetical protein
MCIHKYGPSPSRVYCISAKSTNSNFQFPYCSKTLLLVSWVKIQYTRDGKGPDSVAESKLFPVGGAKPPKFATKLSNFRRTPLFELKKGVFSLL